MSVKGSRLLAAAAAISLLLLPAVADARLGSGSSMGSRGSMTYSAPPSTATAPNSGSAMSRSMTTPTPSPSYGTASPMGSPARSGFMSGLMGGMIGAGIGGMLFGGGFFGHGLGFGGFLGFLLQIFLIVMLGRFLWRRFMGGAPLAFAGGPGLNGRGPGGMPGAMPGGAPARGGPPPIQIAPQDFQAFEQLLYASQAALVARRDHRTLSAGHVATPGNGQLFRPSSSRRPGERAASSIP